MARNIKRKKLQPKRLKLNSILLVFILLSCFTARETFSRNVVDQGIVKIGKRLVTQRDIEKLWLLDQLAVECRPSRSFPSDLIPEYLNKAIDSHLVLAYLRSAGVRQQVDVLVQQQYDKIREKCGDDQRLANNLAYYELKPIDLKMLLEDAMQVRRFLNGEIFQKQPTQEDAKRYFEENRNTKFFGKEYGELQVYILEYLRREGHDKAVEKWLSDRRRGLPVEVLTQTP